jgi:YVTN family beta-propeller protein
MPKVLRWFLMSAGMCVFSWLLTGRADEVPQEKPSAIRLRRPIALHLQDGGKTLLVANRDSGTVSVLHTDPPRVSAEVPVGRKLSDLAGVGRQDFFLVTDERASEVVLLQFREGTLRVMQRLSTPANPVSVSVSDDGRLASIACLWPRRLLILDLTATPISILTALDLPFAPRRQLALPGTSHVLVADAFAGNLAVVNLRQQAVESVRHLPAHNLRGLALDRHGKHLLLTHQVLHSEGRPAAGDIRSGSLISNNVRRLALADVLDPLADVVRHERLYSLGDVERGAGDPTDIAETLDGTVLVALAGVNELAVGRPEEVLWTRLAVGSRPTALAVDAAARRVYVANTFSDTISTVDLRGPRVLAEVRLGTTAANLRPEERGEILFFDARLSFESWFSCHSCHSDGHSNGRLNDNFTDGSFGTPKRVLSLLGVKDTGPWAWNGQMPDLELQVRTSVKNTMQGSAPTAEQVRDLVAYLQTLPPPPPRLLAQDKIDTEALKRGRHVFTMQKCATCHAPPTYTSAKTYDVGLRDEVGGTHFNPPSLRGVSQGGPYFHDGRAKTLAEVFTRYRHQLSGELSEQEVRDLLQFLASL